ncbi:MAG: toxin HipA [Bacteroidetes bacterium CG12_big_fil_rev_8_21_14_0_65_60_17]|nr:MAG: toxin HipA [Bacteroidetes bacterium CG12_big_fil_rev_8_21_14_0_65_60_17]
MGTLAEVRLWGTTIGAVFLDDGETVASFEYAPGFLGSGIGLSPVHLPLRQGVFRFPELDGGAFHGLPGMLADSLPDRYGHALINAWLARQGRTPESFNAVERLCYVGRRGMGALEYEPARGPDPSESHVLQVGTLAELAGRVIRERGRLDTRLDAGEDAIRDILRVGTSAGGARAKALIAWNPETNDVRSDQVHPGDGFSHWVLKFDGVSGDERIEVGRSTGYGAVEYAYSVMARRAGICMPETRLFEEGGRRHFMARRFDRTDEGDKRHMQSLGALLHFDYNLAGAYAHEQALALIRRLGLGMDTVEEQYRRMVFNIVTCNQDDHVKNIAFLMDRRGHWSLSPAFDITWNYNPEGAWTSRHQMRVNGKRDDFTTGDLEAVADAASMKRGRWREILQDVLNAAAAWTDVAFETGIPEDDARAIAATFRIIADEDV